MDLKQMEYFKAIAEEGSISAAAKKLHISQPPLSRQLRLLEEELGVRLLERGARSISLTAAGQLFYKRADRILQLKDASVKEMADFGTGPAILRLGATSSSAPALLNRRIYEYCRKCPDIRFEVHEGNTFELIELLASGIIEVAMVRTPFQAENIDCLYTEKEPMMAAAVPGCMEKHQGDRIVLSALREEPLILYRRFEALVLSACRKEGFSPRIFCKNDDARTTLMWATTGLGVAIVPQSMTNLLPPEALVYKEIECESLQTQISLIWRTDRYLSATAGSFLDLFR